MNVTILKTRFSHQGGAEKQARLLAHAFHERGVHVTVLTTEPVLGTFPFEVVALTPQSLTSVGKLYEFDAFVQEWLSKHPAQMVFGMDRNRFQTHLRAGSGVHRAYLEHRAQFEPLWKRLRHKINPLHSDLLQIEKNAFEHPELEVLFVNSHLVKNEALTHYKTDPFKINVIHNGVEWEDFEGSFDTWQEHYDPNQFELLFIGSDFERKGLRPLLHGMALLSKSDLHLSVVGEDKNRKQFEQLTKGLGLRSQVTFFGAQSALRPFFQKADCLAIPSYYDPFANVTVEALAMGLFVLSSKTNGGHEVLTPTSGHLIEDLRDPESMKKALEVALDRPKNPQQALAIRLSAQPFDLSLQLNAYIDRCLQPI